MAAAIVAAWVQIDFAIVAAAGDGSCLQQTIYIRGLDTTVMHCQLAYSWPEVSVHSSARHCSAAGFQCGASLRQSEIVPFGARQSCRLVTTSEQ